MQPVTPLLPGHVYHIYNRGNNREDLFREESNYRYFLELYSRHVHPVAATFAYCLMRNHFHLLVRIRSEEEYNNLLNQTSQDFETCEVLKPKPFKPSQHFSNLFNAYAKAVNKKYERTGSLFEERFGRIVVTSDAYFCQLVFYIHFNPQKHGFVDDFRQWPWSSYHTLIASAETRLNRTEALEWFGGTRQYEEFHRGMLDEKRLAELVGDELF